MAVTSVLLVIAPLVFLVIASRADLTRRTPLRLLLWIYGLPAVVLLAYSALWRWDATRIVSELHGVAFRSADGGAIRKEIRLRGNRVLIGDTTARRKLPRLGTFVFRPRTARAEDRGTLTIELPPPGQRAGLIATSGEGILGSIAIEKGDQVCVANGCWTYSRGSFTAGSVTYDIPRRQARIPGFDWSFPLPFARPIPMTTRTFAVGAFAETTDLRSFVGYSRHSSSPRFVPLDDNVTFRRGGKVIEGKRSVTVGEGERISFYTLPAEAAAFEAPPVVERRSVVMQAGQRSFALDFDTPETHSLTTAELNALKLDRPDSKAVALAMGDAQLVDRSLYFSGVSESVALQASALIELSKFFPRDFRSTYRVVSPRGPTDAQVGEPAWIGASDLAAIRLLVLRPPLLLLVLALALQLLKAVSAASSRFTLGQALIAGALEILVGARLLFGHRAWAMPPHELEAAELGLVAWMMLPWIFLAACLPPMKLRQVTRPALFTIAGLLVSMLFCAMTASGAARVVWILCHLLALAIPFLRAEAAALGRREDDLRVFVYAAAIFCGVRILLLLFGFKESAMLAGGRISLSAIYIPAAAVLQGLFLARIWNRRLGRDELLAAFGIVALLWGLPAVLTSDIGLALLNVPVFLLLLLMSDRKSLAVRVAIALFTVVVALGPLFRLAMPLVSNEETLLSLASESNYARFLHFAAPEQLQALATKRGESLSITSAILQQYIGSGLFGRGYGHSEASIHLGDTALRDFAPAVFVAAEWGLFGTMAMLMTYALFGIVAYRMIPRRESAMALVAAVAAGTIAIASIYMILANHELVLLTGKNAYLLGLDSAGDVLETFALLLVIAFGTSATRDGAMA
jgi:hypothetical protein